MPFESISGVRFKKPSQDGDISIIVDATRVGGLVATAQIPLSGGLSLQLIDKATLMSSEIIKDFIFDIPTADEERE